MNDQSDKSSSQKRLKAKWVKPTVQWFEAGDAEVNLGTVDDGDPGTSLFNS